MRRYKFDNGYGASVIDDGYGGDMGRFEIAVTHGDAPMMVGGSIRPQLCYRTSVTSDVIGWVRREDIRGILDAIKALPPNEFCAHKRIWIDN